MWLLSAKATNFPAHIQCTLHSKINMVPLSLMISGCITRPIRKSRWRSLFLTWSVNYSRSTLFWNFWTIWAVVLFTAPLVNAKRPNWFQYLLIKRDFVLNWQSEVTSDQPVQISKLDVQSSSFFFFTWALHPRSYSSI